MTDTKVERETERLMGEALLSLGRLGEAHRAFAAAGDTEGLRAVGKKCFAAGRLNDARVAFAAQRCYRLKRLGIFGESV